MQQFPCWKLHERWNPIVSPMCWDGEDPERPPYPWQLTPGTKLEFSFKHSGEVQGNARIWDTRYMGPGRLPVLLHYFALHLRTQTPLFCQDLFFFCRLAIKTNNTPFLLLSTTFSWWTGSAEHTSDNTIWLSLPRVISSSSLLPPSPSHFPSLCLASCST